MVDGDVRAINRRALNAMEGPKLFVVILIFVMQCYGTQGLNVVALYALQYRLEVMIRPPKIGRKL